MKGSLHTHSEYSVNDSAAKVKQLVEKARELGMTSLALTDHGTLLGIDSFMSLAHEDINLIPGCEVYVGTNREHLVLLAEDILGYHDLCNIVTESNNPDVLQINRKRQYPITTLENLAHNNKHKKLIAMSACIQGVVSNILLQNVSLKKAIAKLITLQDYTALCTNYQLAETKLKELKTKLSEAQKDETALPMTIDLLQSNFDMATLSLKKIKKEYVKMTKQNEARIELEQQIVSEDVLYEKAKNNALKMQEIFGKDNFYIELQYHGLKQEEYVAPLLVKIAREIGAKMVITNDIHTINNSNASILARSVMKFNAFENWMEPDQADSELYFKTENQMIEMMRRILPVEIVIEAMDTIDEISSKCHVEFTRSYHYPTYNCDNAAEELRRCTYEGMKKRYANHPNFQKILNDINYELDVIINMGFADYLLITKDFLEFGRKAGLLSYEDNHYLLQHAKEMSLTQLVTYVEQHATEPGLSIGPGRGSAAGSKVCYVIGITDIDPEFYGLMFERFLNPGRVSMPDIDSDFSLEVRQLCIEYCRKKYGQTSVCGITTTQTVAARGSIRLVARAIASKMSQNKNDAQKDEIKQQFLHLAGRITKLIPTGPNVSLKDCMDQLTSTFADDKIAMDIINTAVLIEGTITNTGTHAAGIIISDKPVSDYISLMYDTTNQVFRTQCDMIEAEGIHGLLKMDFLGLRTLSTITMALRQIKLHTGTAIDIRKIPIEKEVIDNIIKTGLTHSIFQFSSAFMRQIIKKIKPESIFDMVLINAVGRPGPSQYIDAIAAIKDGKVQPQYLTNDPEFVKILNPTYSYPVYQEQITQLMQYSGMSIAEADDIRRHMSKKHEAEFMAKKPQFVAGMVAKNIPQQAVEDFWDQLVDFSKYAFNKSHAAAYIDVAYKCAWLLYHYPVYFICAALEFSEKIEDTLGIMENAKTLGINVLPPDVNKSTASFSVESPKDVRFGICSIKGCGDSLRDTLQELLKMNHTYASVNDLMYKTRFSVAVIDKLIKAGACDSFSSNRAAMITMLPLLDVKMKKIKETEKKIKDKTLLVEILSNPSTTKDNWRDVCEQAGLHLQVKNMPILQKQITAINQAQTNLDKLIAEFYAIQIGTCAESKRQRLDEEKEMLGCYVTEHPLDSYEIPNTVVSLSDVVDGTVTVAGLIKHVTHKVTKAKQTPIIFFELEDRIMTAKVNCWTKETENYGNLVKENSVVLLKAKAKIIIDDFDETEKLELTVVSIEPLVEKKPESQAIRKHFTTYEDAVRFMQGCDQYIDDENGVYIQCIIDNRHIIQTRHKYYNVVALKS